MTNQMSKMQITRSLSQAEIASALRLLQLAKQDGLTADLKDAIQGVEALGFIRPHVYAVRPHHLVPIVLLPPQSRR